MGFFTMTVGGILYRFAQLIAAPFVNPAVLWFALPLVITIIAVELYYGRYKDEKMSWNAAMMNALVLIFVALNTFQFVFMQSLGFWKKILSGHFLVALLVFIIGLLLVFGDFFHKLPKKFALSMTVYLPINMLAYTSLVLIYNKVPVDMMTVIAYLMMVIVFSAIFFFVRRIEPEGRSDSFDYSSGSSPRKKASKSRRGGYDVDTSKMDFSTGRYRR